MWEQSAEYWNIFVAVCDDVGARALHVDLDYDRKVVEFHYEMDGQRRRVELPISTLNDEAGMETIFRREVK